MPHKYEFETSFDRFTGFPVRRQSRSPWDIEWHEADWNRNDYEECDPHDFAIDDMGNIQCTDCLMLIYGHQKWKIVAIELEKIYGNSELFIEEFDDLQEASLLVRRRKFNQLSLKVIDYRVEDGRIKTSRKFYNLNKVKNYMHGHKHVLESFKDHPDHHFYCDEPSTGCYTEFWSDLAVDSKVEEAYYYGYHDGLREAYNPIKAIENMARVIRLRIWKSNLQKTNAVKKELK